MKASDLFVKCLVNEGVDRIYGLPGEENADFMMSLEDSPIQFILCRHEQSAAFMADVHGRLTGKSGVCLATLGPGATNLVTGVADANMDRAPVVAITGQADTRRQHKESHQAMDVIGMFRPITKWAQSVQHQDNIPEIVRKAFKIAETEKPGACLIELPEDIAKHETEKTPISWRKLRRPSPDDKILEQALDLIKNAKNPVILAGNGCVRKRSARQLKIFVEQTGIPVITTFMGKGAIPRGHNLSLFTMGLQAKDYIGRVVDQADVVIAIGYDLVEYHPRLWNQGNEKRILHIDFLPAETDENYRVEVEITADVANTLWKINEAIGPDGYEFSNPLHGEVRGQMLKDFAEWRDDDAVGAIKPQKALWDVRECMGPSDILLSDVGAHKMWVARYYQCDEPNTCLISNGFCSMGFALPGAIAAKLVYPDRRVIAVCGDAGVMMNIHDLETAVRYGINVVILIWEDGEYGLIKWKQQNEFGRHTNLKFGNPDFVKLAEAFGAWGARVEKSSDLKQTLEKAFTCGKPALVSIPIDYRENMKLSERLGRIVADIG